MPKAIIEIVGKSPRLLDIIAEHGKYFYLEMQRDINGSPHVTVGDENIRFTTSVKNIRVVHGEDS